MNICMINDTNKSKVEYFMAEVLLLWNIVQCKEREHILEIFKIEIDDIFLP